jgi:hypothetical protein
MKKLILLLSFLIFTSVIGQEIKKFFEVPIQTTNKFRLGSKILIQPIIPYNDFLSGISFCLDNPGISEINIQIKNKNENIIFDKNFDIHIITSTYWGSEYFFPLGKNLPINSGEEYKIIIQPKNLSNLNFYYLYTYELLQGTEEKTYVFESIKELLVNNDHSAKFLKLALYEGREDSPPQISNFKININSPRETKISFNTNEPIKYRFDYFDNIQRTTSTYEIRYYESCPTGIRDCIFKIVTQGGKKYKYLFKASDYWENLATLTGEWETPQEEIKFASEENKTTELNNKVLTSQKFEEQKKETAKNVTFPKSPLISQFQTTSSRNKKEISLQKPTESEKQILSDKEISEKNIYSREILTTTTLTPTEEKTIEPKPKEKENFTKRIYRFIPIILLLVVLISIIFYRKFR